MTPLSSTGASSGIVHLQSAPVSQIDWHDARSEYDRSVLDLLAAIRRCSRFTLSDEEKCHLIEGARKREQAAFVKYKQVLDAG
jgi:hypothetical protein